MSKYYFLINKNNIPFNECPLNECVLAQGVPKETPPDPRPVLLLSYCRCAQYTHRLYFLGVPTSTLSLTVRDIGWSRKSDIF